MQDESFDLFALCEVLLITVQIEFLLIYIFYDTELLLHI